MTHELDAVIYPAPDVPGQWVAHCTTLDAVTQGNDPSHARDMLLDALSIVGVDLRAPVSLAPGDTIRLTARVVDAAPDGAPDGDPDDAG